MENFNELDQTTTPNQDSGSIISHALDIFKNTFLYCLLAVILYYALSYIIQRLTGFDSNSVVTIIKEQAENGSNIDYEDIMNVPGLRTYTGASFLAGIILAPIYTGLIYVANKSNFKEKIVFSDLFFCYRQNFINIVLYGLVCYIAFIISLTLCVIPALFIMPLFFLGYPILIFENASIGEALKKSFSIVQNNYWSIFATALLGGLIAFAGILLCCVGIYLTYPFIFIVMYSTYCAYNGAPRQVN